MKLEFAYFSYVLASSLDLFSTWIGVDLLGLKEIGAVAAPIYSAYGMVGLIDLWAVEIVIMAVMISGWHLLIKHKFPQYSAAYQWILFSAVMAVTVLSFMNVANNMSHVQRTLGGAQA